MTTTIVPGARQHGLPPGPRVRARTATATNESALARRALIGVALAYLFVFLGLPFVVRSVQPVLETLPKEIEEAAATLGADRWQTFRRVILPALAPALVAGMSLSFARAIGEYGSVVFISGNMPGRTEIAPLLIMSKLEQYDYGGATAIAVVMLLTSAVILVGAGLIQRRAARRAA